MQAYTLVVAYDGTAYYGWQQQAKAVTIAGMLEKRFKAVFKQDIKILGASRTDAGVHALGQVARFSLEVDIPIDKIKEAWNNALPQDILIRSIEAVPEQFHPHRGVVEKTYYYHFFDTRPLPFVVRYGFFNGLFDRTKLEDSLQIFVGTHDFRSFCTGSDCDNTVRTIHSSKVHYFRRFGVYRITVKGPGFLRYMIRRIVGACLESASGKRTSVEDLRVALAAKNPRQHFKVAPPQGLLLHHIEYENRF